MDMTASTQSGIWSGISAAGSAESAYFQYKQGQAQKDAYEYNANVALDRMEEAEGASEQQFARLMGKQRSLYAKAGVDISSGSPLLVLADTAMRAKEDQSRIRESGTAESEIQRYYGEMADYSGTVGAFSTFLQGIGKAGQQYQLNRKGIGGSTMGL